MPVGAVLTLIVIGLIIAWLGVDYYRKNDVPQTEEDKKISLGLMIIGLIGGIGTCIFAIAMLFV